jgi:hypothetical protein
MAETARNPNELLKGKQVYSSLYGVYTEALHDMPAVLKGSAAIEETAKTAITAPPSIEEFREQRRQKRKLKDKRAKNPTTSITGVNNPQFRSNFPAGNS